MTTINKVINVTFHGAALANALDAILRPANDPAKAAALSLFDPAQRRAIVSEFANQTAGEDVRKALYSRLNLLFTTDATYSDGLRGAGQALTKAVTWDERALAIQDLLALDQDGEVFSAFAAALLDDGDLAALVTVMNVLLVDVVAELSAEANSHEGSFQLFSWRDIVSVSPYLGLDAAEITGKSQAKGTRAGGDPQTLERLWRNATMAVTRRDAVTVPINVPQWMTEQALRDAEDTVDIS